jgi:hypothetical protein
MARRILGLAAAHFAVALVVAVLAYGPDMDQLRSRSAVSRAAGHVHDLLWFPHDAALRALPNRWFVAHAKVVTPVLIVGNSLVWGLFLYGVRHGVRRARRRG